MKLVLYFADAFSWEYVRKRPFMEDFWAQRRPLESVLGYSSTVMPVILTGRPPRETGIWTEYFYEPRPQPALVRILLQPHLRFLLPTLNAARLVWFRVARKAGLGIEHRLRLPIQLSHLFSRHPIKYDRFPPIGLPVKTLADLFAERGLRVDFRYLRRPPLRSGEIEHLRSHANDADVFFYYDPTLDGLGHKVGASVSALAPSLDGIAEFLEEVSEVMAPHDLELLLFSDHGMTTVTDTFDLFAELRDFTLGIEYLVFMDSTFARFWFASDSVRDQILELLSEVPGSFLSEEERKAYGIDFDDERYGQEILVAEEGIVFHPNYFPGPFRAFTKKYPEEAMHGYRPECPSAQGVLFYRGDRLSQDLPDPFPVHDIFGVVEELTRNSAR